MYRARNSTNRHNCKVLFETRNGVEYIVFDTETTGVNPEKDYIIELAASKYTIVDKKPVLGDSLHVYMRPPILMDSKVIAIHGITNEFLRDKPTEAECFAEIRQFFGRNAILCGHNIPFDIRMLSALYAHNGDAFTYRIYLDTLEMARDNLTDKDIKSYLSGAGLSKEEIRSTKLYNLGVLTKLYGLDYGLTFHSAQDDVTATSRLLETMYLAYAANPVAPDRPRLGVRSFNYWKGYSREQSGLWVNTYQGRLWFSTYFKDWRSSAIDLSQYNIDELEQYILNKMEINMNELEHMTEKTWFQIRERMYNRAG